MTTCSDDAHISAIDTRTHRSTGRFVVPKGNIAGRRPSRTAIWILLLAGLLTVFPIVGANRTAVAAQDAPAPPENEPDLATQLGLNEGVSLQQLAVGTADSVPLAPVILRLEEVSVEPGQREETTLTRGPELLYMESGELTAEDNIGFRAVLSEGRQVLFHEGFGYSLINESDQPASMLRLAVRPVTSESSSATPSPSPSTASTANALILFQSHLDEVPADPALLFLGRMTLDPEANTGQYWHDGSFGMILESGDLTVYSPSGLDVPLITGAAQLLPALIAHNEVNPGPVQAEALIFAFVNADGGLLRPGTPAESATPTP